MIPAIVPLVAMLLLRASRGRSEDPAPVRPDGPATPVLQRPIPAWVWMQLGYPLVLVIVRGAGGDAVAIPLAVVLYLPWLLARGAARLGLALPARLLAWLARFTFSADPRGAGSLAAALALVHRRAHDEELARRLIARLDGLPGPVRGAQIAARALVAVSRGHADEARDLLRSVDHLDRRITPRAARGLAREWLAADAAARGDWPEVVRLACAPGVRPRRVRFLGLIGRRLAGGPGAPGDLRLRLAWLVTPRRRATRPLLDLALAAPGVAEPRSRVSAGTRLQRAAALHLEVLALPAPLLRPAAVAWLGRAWDAALGDPGTARALLERELALGAEGRSEAVRRLHARVQEDLAGLVEQSGFPLRSRRRGLLAAAVARVRDALLEDLHADAERMYHRAKEGPLLPTADEWRALARLREAHRGAVARLDEQGRRIAWEIAHPALSAAAVRLFNIHQERSLANAVFRYLATEAEAVGDSENQALHEKNCRCGW